MCSISYALVLEYVSCSFGSTSASVSPGVWTRKSEAGMRACSSGVSLGCSRSGSSAGSPTGSLPSGSRCAARCPCVRSALTSDIAAATPPSSASSGAEGVGSGAAGGAGSGAASAWPFVPRRFSSRRARPGSDSIRSPSPLSKSARHSDGTASGFSRYCSSRTLA